MSSTITINYHTIIAETAVELAPYYDKSAESWLEYIVGSGHVQVRLMNDSVVWMERDRVTMHPDDGILGPTFTVRMDYWKELQEAKKKRIKKSEWFQN